MSLGILIPTRGMVFSEMFASLLEERDLYGWAGSEVYTSIGLPIPEAHNHLVELALKDGVENILFWEEDIVPPDGSLEKVMYVSEDIAFIDYSVNGWSCSAKDEEGKLLWAGLGFTRIRSDVFRKMKKPYFRTDKQLRLNDGKWIDVPKEKAYGGHDIWFFRQAFRLGATIRQLEGECGHMKMDGWGNKDLNNGFHNISFHKKIEKQQIISFDYTDKGVLV